MRSDRQTDGYDKAILAFCNFANAPKNQREIFELGIYLASFLNLAPSLAVDLVASNNGTLRSGDQLMALFQGPIHSPPLPRSHAGSIPQRR